MKRTLLLLLLLPTLAQAETVQKRIAIASIAPGDSVTTNAYLMPTGATSLSIHFEAYAPKFTVRVEYKTSGSWATGFTWTENNAVWGSFKTMVSRDITVVDGTMPANVQYRAIIKNTHATAPATQILGYIRYWEPDETH